MTFYDDEGPDYQTLYCVTCLGELGNNSLTCGHVHHPELECAILATFCSRACETIAQQKAYTDKDGHFCLGYKGDWNIFMGLKGLERNV